MKKSFEQVAYCLNKLNQNSFELYSTEGKFTHNEYPQAIKLLDKREDIFAITCVSEVSPRIRVTNILNYKDLNVPADYYFLQSIAEYMRGIEEHINQDEKDFAVSVISMRHPSFISYYRFCPELLDELHFEVDLVLTKIRLTASTGRLDYTEDCISAGLFLIEDYLEDVEKEFTNQDKPNPQLQES